MKVVRQRLVGLLSLFAWSCLVTLPATANAAEPLAEHVVVISVDGLPAFLFTDPNVPLIHIRELAAEGTVAEGMTVSNPSVTWPNHTTLVTGAEPMDHGVLFNGVLERPGLGLPVKVNPRKDKSDLVLIPTIVDELHQQGLKTAGINWPCTRNSDSFDVDFPDTPESLDHTTPKLKESLKAAGILTDEVQKKFARMSPLVRDRIWTEAACEVIRSSKPELLLLHLLNVDAVHHRYGPRTWAGYSAVAYADTCVGEVLTALDDAGIREKTTVIVLADHGFAKIPKTIQPNVLLRKAGLVTVEGNRVTAARAFVIPEGGIGMLYLTVPDTAKEDQKKAMEIFKNQEGIADVLTPDKFAEYGLPQPEDYPQMANLILVAKDGYGFSGTATGEDFVVASTRTLGTHGFLSTNPAMQAAFVASGAGIQPGKKIGVIKNTQVAPTVATLLGVPLPHATGKPLDQILVPKK